MPLDKMSHTRYTQHMNTTPKLSTEEAAAILGISVEQVRADAAAIRRAADGGTVTTTTVWSPEEIAQRRAERAQR